MQVLTNNEIEQVSGGRMAMQILIGVVSSALWDAAKGTYSYVTSQEYGYPTYNMDAMGNY